MHRLSSILAFITNKIFIILLIITTLALAQTVAIAQVITNKDKIKNILSESQVYKNLPENAIYVIKLDDSEEQEQDQTVNSKTLYEILEENGFIKTQDLNNVIVAVVSPDFLQNQTENLIDGVYNFLDGNNHEILFTFSLKDRANTAKIELNKVINEKLAGLPVCSYEQIINQQGQDINVLEAACLPPGISLQSKIDEFTNELTSKDGIFGQEFTQKDIEISDADANLAKYVYSSIKNMIWMFWLLFVSFSAVIILTSKTLHRGLKTTGGIHISLGAFLLIGYLFIVNSYNFVDNIILSSNDLSAKESEALTAISAPIFESFVNQVVTQITIISLIIIIIGILLFILGIFTTKHHIEHLYLPRHNNNDTKETSPDKPKDDNKEKVQLATETNDNNPE